jgi:hypothetical protein
MLLSQAMCEMLLKNVREHPVEKDEVRRIVGMGEMYFARTGNRSRAGIRVPFLVENG